MVEEECDLGQPVTKYQFTVEQSLWSCETPKMPNVGLDPARELASYKYALDKSAIVAITDKVGRIIYANEKFCQISGFSQAELLGQTHRIINSGYHPKSFFDSMWKTISSGKIWFGELCNRAKNGNIYWVYTTIVPFLDEAGKPYQYMAVRFEITDKKQADEQIENLFNSAIEGIIVCDEEGQILEANRAAASMFGYALGEMIYSKLSHYVEIPDNKTARPVVSGSVMELFETKGRKRDGGEFVIEAGEKHYTYRGSPARLVIVRDISGRKQLEAQIVLQDRLASIGLLASSLAHEIGTPLGVIRGRAEFLAHQLKENKAALENLPIIVSQIDRVSALIRSLLNLARGDTSSKLGTGFVNQVVTDVLNLMAYELRRNDIAMDNRIPVDVSVKVVAETEPLHQVFLNLIVNGVQAIESALKQGGADRVHSISVSAEDLGENWAIHVEDTGTGISDENMRNLFKPFFTTKDVGVGTGLGLVTSFRIVERWGGTIKVKSKLGSGSVFSVILPKA